MGQAKRNKARLGEWYGRPIVPGHPDFVPPKRSERRTETAREEPMHPEVVRTLSGIDGAREVQTRSDESPEDPLPAMHPKERRLPAFAMLGILGMALASGTDLDPIPSPARRTKFR